MIGVMSEGTSEGRSREIGQELSAPDKRKLRRQVLAEKKRQQKKPQGIQKPSRSRSASQKDDAKTEEALSHRVLRSRELAMNARQKKKEKLDSLQTEISKLQQKATELEAENKELLWKVQSLVDDMYNPARNNSRGR
ncbi:hypothetical protein NDN08_002861 [Rhodosorus marinus]|uniref:BZIP domain-containing protein n=1 Tax=Rhodosorus marinus TaxID=101924 RepID=A0AAV8UYZ1_9RHOD|nr:hypothetical protein NDN08_002861 [Rhodosorus marinus]